MTYAHAIISIRPEYAEAIISGVKTVELRRRIPQIEPGIRLWIYSTLPVGAVVGSVTVQEIFRGTPATVWKRYSKASAIGQVQYHEYFSGTEDAIGLILKDVQQCTPVRIDRLRKLRKGFHPPQVLTRLSEAESSQLSKWAMVTDAPLRLIA